MATLLVVFCVVVNRYHDNIFKDPVAAAWRTQIFIEPHYTVPLSTDFR